MIFRYSENQKKQLRQIETDLNKINLVYLSIFSVIKAAKSIDNADGTDLINLMTREGDKVRYLLPDDQGHIVSTEISVNGDKLDISPEQLQKYKQYQETEIPRQTASLNNQFSNLLNQFENEHMESLKTSADVVQDAKTLTTEAIYAAYSQYATSLHVYDGITNTLEKKADQTGKKEEKPSNADYLARHVLKVSIEISPFSWDYAEKIDRYLRPDQRRSEELKNPQILLDREGLFRWIKDSVIDKHLDRLAADQKESARLLKDVRQIIDAAPVTEVNKLAADFWKSTEQASKKEKNKLEKVQQFQGKRADNYMIDVSKAALKIWNAEDSDKKNHFQINVKSEKDEKRANLPDRIDVFYDYDFSNIQGLTISKDITSYDRLVYTIIAALRDAGNTVFTDRQIFNLIEGKDKRPAKNQLQKIRKSIEKMGYIRVKIDTSQEAEYYKSKPRIRYNGPILPIEELENVAINGNVTEVAYHILENRLPLIDVSKQRGQVSTAPASVLQIPLNMNDANLDISFYLQTRISREKHKKGKGIKSFKILLSSLYEQTHITSKMQKQRAPEKITAILNHWQNIKFIKSYHLEKDRITIFLEQD